MSIRINPSILASDFGNLEAEFQSVAAADYIHVDVMDNHFVPNLTFGLPVVSAMQAFTPKPLDIHLMIENVDEWAVKYAEIGSFSVTFHHEASRQPIQVARSIKSAGSRAGLAIKPGTPFQVIEELLPEFDQILIMTVEPGFGGQALIEDTLPKVAAAHRKISDSKFDIWLQVDGGIDEANIARVAELGADTFVAGSAVFKAVDRNAKIQNLRKLAEQGHLHIA